MACYWGCRTGANKVAWSLSILFVIIGVALAAPGIVGARKCFLGLYGCNCTPVGACVRV